MPTKVIIQQAAQLASPSQNCILRGRGPGPDDELPRSSSIRQTKAFKSSLLREINVVPQSESTLEEQRTSTVSSSDITGSPRLLGYVFTLVASLVMLVSVAQFHTNQKIANAGTSTLLDSNGKVIDESVYEDDSFVHRYNVAVFRWKLIGTFVAAGFGVVANLFIILAHFDKYFLPSLWTIIFRDGSRGERNLLVFMLLSGAVTLYTNTSVLSVGENQPNVYFTSWISFGTIVLTYNIWRESANLRTLEDIFLSHRKKSQKEWVLLTFTTLVSALSSLDSYLNRDRFVVIVESAPESVPQGAWTKTLCLSYGGLAACIIALIGNNTFHEPFEMKLCGSYKLTLDWRQVEGLLAVGTLGTFLYVIFYQTGVATISSQNTLGNGYFSSWFSFLISTNVFGTWIRENKNFLIVSRARVRQRIRKSMTTGNKKSGGGGDEESARVGV